MTQSHGHGHGTPHTDLEDDHDAAQLALKLLGAGVGLEHRVAVPRQQLRRLRGAGLEGLGDRVVVHKGLAALR